MGDIIGTRILQGIGSSAVLSVGAGTVGDIYRPTERANAMAWFYSGVLLGPALSPILAGMFTEYTAITWRATQYFMCGASALAFALLALCFPETSHPVLPHHAAQKARGKKFVLYVFNPLVSLGLLQYGNIVMATIASSFIMLQTYCVMVPLSVIFQERYNIHNVAVAGCVYLSVGVGTLIGSRIGGPLSDRTVLKYMKKRGYRRPEDRLHATLLGAGLINPASCLVYGWLLWANKGGMAPPLVMLVINGVGMNLSLTPLNTYLVDSSQKRSAEAIAVNNFWRYLFAAAASAFVLPMIEAIGPGWTMTFASAMAWVAFGCIVATMRFGEGWRESANARIARRAAKAEAKAEVEEDEKEAAGKVPAPVVEEKAPPRPGSPIGIGFAAREDDGEFLDLEHDAVFLNELEHELEHERERHAHAHDRPSASETQPKPETDHKKKERHGLGDRLRHFAHTHHVHNPLSRRHSTTSSDHDHGEAEHGEPTHLVQLPRARVRGRGTLTRERSRRSSGATLPSVGEVLQRTVSLSGASVHG